jgi:hypothetical protein
MSVADTPIGVYPDSRVFVACKTHKHDLDGLKRFGEIVPMSTRSIFPDWSELAVEAHLDKMYDVLVDYRYRAGRDWIALTGDPIAIAYAGILASGMAVERVRFLKFDAKAGEYYPVIIRVRNQMIGDRDAPKAKSNSILGIMGSQGSFYDPGED